MTEIRELRLSPYNFNKAQHIMNFFCNMRTWI